MGSLRYALNNATPGEVIDFAPGVRTIDLSNTLNTAGLTIGVNLTITNDQGVGPVTIDGGGQFTVFTVSFNVTASLSGLTIADGNTNNSGGGISNNGTLALTNCTFSDNSTTGYGGGGIENDGTLTVNNSSFFIVARIEGIEGPPSPRTPTGRRRTAPSEPGDAVFQGPNP